MSQKPPLSSNKRDSLFNSERSNEVPKESLKKAPPAELHDPWLRKPAAPLYHRPRAKGQSIHRAHREVGYIRAYPKINSISYQRVKQRLCIFVSRIDNSLSNTKFNEEEHNLQVIKKIKRTMKQIKMFTT